MKKRCLCCKKTFKPDKYHPSRKFCGNPSCQRFRRNRYQKDKLKNDKDYRANRADAQKQWRITHKDYWKAYRLRNPDYVKTNRELTLNRYRRKKLEQKCGCGDFAKIHFASSQFPVKSGRYRLDPLEGDFAKKDFAIVQLSILEPLTRTG